MKYLLPEIIFIIIVMVFTNSYVNFCIDAFMSTCNFFGIPITYDHAYLAFPIISLFIFFIFSLGRNFLINGNYDRNNENYFKRNAIYFMVIFAYLLQMRSAFNEVEIIPADWPLTLSKLKLFFDVISTFFIGNIFSSVIFPIKKIFK